MEIALRRETAGAIKVRAVEVKSQGAADHKIAAGDGATKIFEAAR
jgi:hypothetical protein